MFTNAIPFKAEDSEGVKEKVVRGKHVVPSYLSVDVESFLKKLLTLIPEQRENLEAIMPDPWLNMGQEEELKPYVEPPGDVIDPGVIEQMLNLGIHWEDIKDTLSNKTYNNNIKATYRMLHTQKPKSQYRTINVKPFHPPEFQSHSRPPSPEVSIRVVRFPAGRAAAYGP
ncbi:hypothetical protein mRhiFer1_008253 [Rhinolophus ferrumequinum]|uniref:Uncharacterized protein n=1 Tax=Rhinolophus ferrumequinum TaxID=59479 RepID=A0A7J7VQQ4_RHIFE|nr:hypothetical protein mRhiFer1_008253 [Rhinolophus ferrumequinum]